MNPLLPVLFLAIGVVFPASVPPTPMSLVQTNITWTTQVNELGGKPGAKLRLVCPPNGTISSRVWGTDLYTDDSSICSSAVHAGLITTAKGGEVSLLVEAGAPSYKGSVRNGVRSTDFGSFTGSFRFIGPGPTSTPVDWNTQANNMGGKSGSQFQLLCPRNGTISSRVWGTDLYTDDSSICTSAVHAGLITTVSGGEVSIALESGAPSYRGSVRNGVKSTDYGAFSGSFRFTGKVVVKPDVQGDIGLNGCWNQCSIHLYHEGENLIYSATWKNALDCRACVVRGWVVERATGWVRGRDVYLHDVVRPSLIVRGLPQGKAEYFMTLSADGSEMNGYWAVDGKRGDNLRWARDK